MTNAEAVAARFAVAGSVLSVESHPTGHINDAYLVVTDRARYLLQRLNPSVFSDPDAVMANVVAVTGHLQAKGELTLTLVPATDAGRSWRDAGGAVWRLYEYIEGVRPLRVETVADAALVGRTFGRFHRLVADLDAGTLGVSLPGFHDPDRRVAQLDAAVSADSHNRLRDASDDVDALLTLGHTIGAGMALTALPTRVAHNDAKAANVLVDENERDDRPPVVVDLDTVMAGSVLWDVGDMIRSSTGTAEEGVARVSFDVDRYHALVDGWLGETDGLLTQAERDAVPQAGPVVTFEQAVRFLTDHLEGDAYFRVAFPGENLDRARNQLDLLRSMVAAL